MRSAPSMCASCGVNALSQSACVPGKRCIATRLTSPIYPGFVHSTNNVVRKLPTVLPVGAGDGGAFLIALSSFLRFFSNLASFLAGGIEYVPPFSPVWRQLASYLCAIDITRFAERVRIEEQLERHYDHAGPWRWRHL